MKIQKTGSRWTLVCRTGYPITGNVGGCASAPQAAKRSGKPQCWQVAAMKSRRRFIDPSHSFKRAYRGQNRLGTGQHGLRSRRRMSPLLTRSRHRAEAFQIEAQAGPGSGIPPAKTSQRVSLSDGEGLLPSLCSDEPRAERTEQRVRQRSTHRVRDFVFAASQSGRSLQDRIFGA
jgi:hypothetical protein